MSFAESLTDSQPTGWKRKIFFKPYSATGLITFIAKMNMERGSFFLEKYYKTVQCRVFLFGFDHQTMPTVVARHNAPLTAFSLETIALGCHHHSERM